MHAAEVRRLIVAVVIAVAIVALIAFARNGPGVGGRVPDLNDVGAPAVEAVAEPVR